MVEEESDLSGAAKETLLSLYDGPLRLRQILERVNALETGDTQGEHKDRTITESALRKRLELLIGRGIIARAGSERTNPYYYIRRPWIFNKYILIKCRDKPHESLLDLTVLLHELTRMGDGENAALPHPRFISAVGERTERSHQIETAYAAFQKILGNSSAIGDYLEGIYDDIYAGKIPESDIDSMVARNFLRFVATSPVEERETRFFLWYADFFTILNLYREAYEAFVRGVTYAEQQGLALPVLLSESRITKGHILLHLNDLTGAKEAYLELVRIRDADPILRAKGLLGAGEVELLCGDYAPTSSPARFVQALELCGKADPAGTDPDVAELRADILRRTGTACRLSGKFDAAAGYYDSAEEIYLNGMIRGRGMLLPERAELFRARAFLSGPVEAEKECVQAAAAYDEAKTVAQRVRSVNWFAHCLIGECECARVAFRKCKKPFPRDLDTKLQNAFEIYCQISSHWGLVQTFLSESLLFHAAPESFPDRYASTADKLEQAERFSRELGLKNELAIIQRIKSGCGQESELHPLTFL
jgi:tetratricopeptide (TPR) repeat protein